MTAAFMLTVAAATSWFTYAKGFRPRRVERDERAQRQVANGRRP